MAAGRLERVQRGKQIFVVGNAAGIDPGPADHARLVHDEDRATTLASIGLPEPVALGHGAMGMEIG